MGYYLIFAIACAITFLITPSIRYFALRYSVIDRKGERKVHDKVVTRFGGLAIYLGFIYAMITAFYTESSLIGADFPSFRIIILASTLVLILGIYDDVRGANSWVKIVVQILAALILIKAGFVIKIVSNPFGQPINLGVFSIAITMLWLVGITNAINLIDGLDGLAAGIVLFSSLGLFFVFFTTGRLMPAFFAMALGGSCLGFLRYNFSPAQMFMGDTGSMFLGFSIAALAILASRKATTAIILLVPIIGLGIPILDTCLAFFRRLLRRTSPFTPDKEHIHHLLLRFNLTGKQVVIILLAITALLNIIACVISYLR
jgi:UDP-GlcNAc:undecaprenyl-phosphate/decaprenyl-phosphate GlcNAc-1-phosphate transferase